MPGTFWKPAQQPLRVHKEERWLRDRGLKKKMKGMHEWGSAPAASLWANQRASVLTIRYPPRSHEKYPRRCSWDVPAFLVVLFSYENTHSHTHVSTPPCTEIYTETGGLTVAPEAGEQSLSLIVHSLLPTLSFSFLPTLLSLSLALSNIPIPLPPSHV